MSLTDLDELAEIAHEVLTENCSAAGLAIAAALITPADINRRGTDAAREAVRQARGNHAAPQTPILFSNGTHQQ